MSRRPAFIRLALALCVAVPALASAQSAAPMPAADSLLRRYRAAINADALAGIRSLRSTGTFEMPAAGLKAALRVEQSAPNRMRMSISLPGAGDIVQGYDGRTGYAIDPTQGPRLMAGGELTQLQDEADLRATSRPAELIAGAETVSRGTMGGVACWMVRLTWRSGRETRDCFAVESGLLVGSMVTQQSPMGAMETSINYSDYRTFAGMLIPARTSVKVMGSEQVITITSVERDAVTTDLSVLPAPIAALAKASEKGKTGAP